MYNLLSTKLPATLVTGLPSSNVIVTGLVTSLVTVPCTVLYKTLNMHPAASIIGCQFWELIGCLFLTFSGAPGFNVDDSLDGAYLGPFMFNLT